MIDPVYPTWERDLALINSLGLKLAYTLDTHIHADHITAAQDDFVVGDAASVMLKNKSGSLPVVVIILVPGPDSNRRPPA